MASIPLNQKAKDQLKQKYPGWNNFKQLEAPSRQEINNLKRDGWVCVDRENNIYAR